MELPKNVTQIGEPDRGCRIYVEDYVVSYIKQMNRLAYSKELAVALYGLRKTEGEISFLFLYGACRLDTLQRETRHLSQAQYQEIEKLRKKYFADQEFLGYRLLNGEMVEGFHICERDACRYISGYAQFYEKNDGMLNYMLETRQEEAVPEEVPREKYETVRKRQEERKPPVRTDLAGTGHEERGRSADGGFGVPEPGGTAQERYAKNATATGAPPYVIRRMRVSVAILFGLLLLVGASVLLQDNGLGGIRQLVRRTAEELMEKKIPDAESVLPVDGTDVEAGFLPSPELTPSPETAATPGPEPTPEPTLEPAPTPSPGPTNEPDPTPVPPTPEPTTPPVVAAASYVVKSGDTLIGICVRQYGSETLLQEVCEVNGIKDPDDIKIGQKILLP